MWAGNTLNSGGAGGSDLWKFASGAAGDIDLKTASGVTGINSVNPQDSRFSLVLSKVAGVPVSLFSALKAGLNFITGIIEDGAGMVSLISVIQGGSQAAAFVDETLQAGLISTDGTDTGAVSVNKLRIRNTVADASEHSVLEWLKTRIFGEVGDVDDRTQLTLQKTFFLSKTEDIALNDFVSVHHTFNFYEADLVIGGASKSTITLDSTNVHMQENTANGAMYFHMTEDGAGAGSDLGQMVLYYAPSDRSVSVEVFRDYAFMQFASDFLTLNNRMQFKVRVQHVAVEYNDAPVLNVDKDGKIYTNQISLGGGVVVPDSELILFDLAGNSYKIAAQKI